MLVKLVCIAQNTMLKLHIFVFTLLAIAPPGVVSDDLPFETSYMKQKERRSGIPHL